MRIKFPLKYFLLVITASLVLMVGGSIGWSSNSTIQSIINDSSVSTSHNIRKALSTQLRNENDLAIAVLSMLSHHSNILIDDIENRIDMLPMFADALNNMDNLITIYIGDSNGTFFSVRKLTSSYDYKRFRASKNCAYVVQNINSGNSTFTLFDKNLKKVASHRELQSRHYDPRVRTWYRMALKSQEVIKTPVYDFSTVHNKGYTIAKRIQPSDVNAAHETVVIGTDIRVGYLEKKLDQLKPTPNSEISFVDSLGNIVAGNNIDKALYLKRLHNRRGFFDNETAYYSIDEITSLSGTQYFLVLNVPKTDIYGKALELHKDQITFIFILLIFGTYISSLFSRKLSNEIQLLFTKISNVKAFNFSKVILNRSNISEIKTLSNDIDSVSSTINAFKTLTYHVTSANNANKMVISALKDISYFTEIPTAILFTRKDNGFAPFKGISRNRELSDDQLAYLKSISDQLLSTKAMDHGLSYSKNIDTYNRDFLQLSKLGNRMLIIPLTNRERESNGVLLFLSHEKFQLSKKKFIKDLSPYISLSLESKFNIDKQKELFDSFIHLIADAIDAKNPATANHCIRVPELTRQLAIATSNKKEGPFADFGLNKDEWEMLYIASWLHDCGKITTPEYVLDKATKLETVHNRIHEIRMRFEILKREKEIEYWKAIATNSTADYSHLQQQLDLINEDFYFIARCNLAGNALTDDDIKRIDTIASQVWTATLDDSIGLSLDELRRRKEYNKIFPRKEPLISDRVEDKIERHSSMSYPKEMGIKMNVPTYLYNRGELTNLKIRRGTLTDEERFKINEHVIQSLLMLSSLPLPKHLDQIPDWAASHHERMDGNGYPRHLTKDEMHPVARMIAIADVYEALTAHDRPYKTNKSHHESINIMSNMCKEGHLDPDLFEIFINDCSFDQ